MSARKAFQTALFAFAAVLTLLGLWWVLQGTGLVPVGFKANHMQWAWRGVVLAATGIALAAAAWRLKV